MGELEGGEDEQNQQKNFDQNEETEEQKVVVS